MGGICEMDKRKTAGIKSSGPGERNYAIEFYRFLFACVVYCLHARDYGSLPTKNGEFSGGYLCVEFFFILTGFFMMRNILSKQKQLAGGATPESLALEYFIARYKKLMPQYWLSIVLMTVITCEISRELPSVTVLLEMLPEFFAVQAFGISAYVNGFLWFVSDMLWASAIVYYLVLCRKDFMTTIFFPVGLLVAVGYLYRNVGYIDVTSTKPVEAFLRAFFEIGFGCVLYQVFVKLQDYNYNRIFMTLLEAGLLSTAMFILWRTRRDYKDFIMVFVMGALILVTALNQGWITKLLNNKVSAWLGSLSYIIYVNQASFRLLSRKYYQNAPYWTVTVAALLALTLYAWLNTKISQWLRPKILRHLSLRPRSR